MATIQTQQELQDAIKSLEHQQMLDKVQLKAHYNETYESIQPANILKHTLTEINTSESIKKDLIKASIALTVGYLAKKIVQTYLIKSRTPISLGIENVIQIIISGLIARNGSVLKNIAMHFFKLILQKRQKQLLLPAHQ